MLGICDVKQIERELVRVSSAVCSNANGGQQNSGQHGQVLLLDMPSERCCY